MLLQKRLHFGGRLRDPPRGDARGNVRGSSVSSSSASPRRSVTFAHSSGVIRSSRPVSGKIGVNVVHRLSYCRASIPLRMVPANLDQPFGSPRLTGVDEALVPAVYNELRRLAHAYLRGERPGHTLQATALVHEAYLRLIAQQPATWDDRSRFIGIAAHLMRQILVEYARGRRRDKRGGKDQRRVPLDESMAIIDPAHADRWEALDACARSIGDAQPATDPDRRAPIFRRPHDRGNRLSSRSLRKDGQARLGGRPRVAAPRVGRAAGDDAVERTLEHVAEFRQFRNAL